MLSFPFGETVTLLRRALTGQDQYGNDVYSDTATDLRGCVVVPRNSSELVQGQDTIIVGLTLYAPAGTALAATDRFSVRGLEYEVDGEPGEYRSPLTGSRGPVQVALTRVTG